MHLTYLFIFTECIIQRKPPSNGETTNDIYTGQDVGGGWEAVFGLFKLCGVPSCDIKPALRELSSF